MMGMLGGSHVWVIRARLILEITRALSGPDTMPHTPIFFSYGDAG